VVRLSTGEDIYIEFDEGMIVVGLARSKPSTSNIQSQLMVDGANCGFFLHFRTSYQGFPLLLLTYNRILRHIGSTQSTLVNQGLCHPVSTRLSNFYPYHTQDIRERSQVYPPASIRAGEQYRYWKERISRMHNTGHSE
jgi:hypothetical protein